MSTTAPPPTNLWRIEPESEYRFELEQGEAIAIRVTRGQAEVFGAEMAPERWYHFLAGCKAAVFSWEGSSTPSTEYTSQSTNLPALSTLHLALEAMRLRSHRHQLHRSRNYNSPSTTSAQRRSMDEKEWETTREEEDSPRVMVLGPEGSGKTSVVRTMINWTVRAGRGWEPVLVNLDPSEGLYSPPGTLSLTPILHPCLASSPSSPFGSPLPTGPPPSLSSTLIPLSTWYGYPQPGQPGRTQLWESLVRELGEKWEERRKGDRAGASAGLIVDTSGRFVEANLGSGGGGGEGGKGKYGFVRDVVDAFKINVLIVVGHEKLHMEMQRMFGGPSSRIKLVKLPKSDGVVDLDAAYRSRAQALQIRSYFYGDPVSPPTLDALVGATAMAPLALSPHSSVVKFEDLTIYRVGEEYIAPSSALPIGASRTISETQLIKVDPTLPASESKLLNALLALVRVTDNKAGKGGEVKSGTDVDKKPAGEEGEEGEDMVEGEVGEEVSKSEIAGYAVITSIDLVRKKFTILSPNPGKLPSRTALVGSFEWQEM